MADPVLCYQLSQILLDAGDIVTSLSDNDVDIQGEDERLYDKIEGLMTKIGCPLPQADEEG